MVLVTVTNAGLGLLGWVVTSHTTVVSRFLLTYHLETIKTRATNVMRHTNFLQFYCQCHCTVNSMKSEMFMDNAVMTVNTEMTACC